MANKFARSNGDFNNPSIWSLSATGLSATTVPTIGDNAIANTYTIQITGNVACDNITSWNTYGGTAGGTFNLGNGSQVTANIGSGNNNTTKATTLSGTNSSVIIGNLASNPWGSIINSGSGNLVINGIISCNSVNEASVTNSSTGTITVNNAVITGSTTGTTGYAISNTGTGTINIVNGSINGATSPAIYSTSTGSVTVLGNVTGDSRGGAGIASTNAAANVRISGNLISAPNGIPAVYAASYTVNPVPYQTYIRYANNGTGVGSDAYLYHYTTDSLSAFSMPPVSAVRAGVQYANNTLTGTCQIPPVSSVAFGTLVDNTTGTAILTSNNLWETSVASLTAANSLGARLKGSATVESVGRILASF